ncbi:hypothetical protein BOX15_Mlig006658g1 [Macrostomum lignano]|uniref:Uncharacterized protein n=1 Tax=Macrostomum lignano TaxID=282301 RepID=A0A267G9H8_9PLAT|nr:hypothetical protein BOX15_Mlig006658g2 [Macrostomum lignano]PAA81949.1 hypothetical protein BOX15_Mlig006658g1 [Macrostomum lignano]
MSDLSEGEFVVRLRHGEERQHPRLSKQRQAVYMESLKSCADAERRLPRKPSHTEARSMPAAADQTRSPDAARAPCSDCTLHFPDARENPPSVEPCELSVTLRRTPDPDHVTAPPPQRFVEVPELLPQEPPGSWGSGTAHSVSPGLLQPPGILPPRQSSGSNTPGIPSWVTDRTGSSFSTPSSANRLQQQQQQQQQPVTIVQVHRHYHTHNYTNCVIHLPELR